MPVRHAQAACDDEAQMSQPDVPSHNEAAEPQVGSAASGRNY